MPSKEVRALIAIIGLHVQLGGAVLLVALFSLLRHHARRRGYFRLWGRAWLAVAVAIGALVVRFVLLRSVPEPAPLVRGLYLVYHFAKLLYFALLVAGTVLYCSGRRARRVVRYAVAAAAGYTLVSVGISHGLSAIVLWQSPVAVLSLGYCAFRFLRLPPSRRTLGSRATGSFFAFVTILWALYFVAFGVQGRSGAPEPLRWLIQYNAYFDLLLQMLLGYGMVVLLMEDERREVTDAHSELAVAHDRLRRVALYDTLTGCLNRRAFTEGVGLEGARATFGAVVMIDLDNLKDTNDGYGHAVGDEILRRLADSFHQATRPLDRLYRWGGDEFLLVLPGTRADEIQPLLEERIARMNAEAEAEGALPLLLSMGSADYDDAEQLEAAIRLADDAMYAQKVRHRRERQGGRRGNQEVA
ncbi:MAG: GGDEF domain-containing protein [Gemmatimonadetes bacterium]|nr:GGDEF domain-containing protein [Gemmatimonadota bacterium]